jgi:hypothetical protein
LVFKLDTDGIICYTIKLLITYTNWTLKGGGTMSKGAWLCLGIGTEALHVVFIFAILIFGKLWLSSGLVHLAITITVMGQIIFLWCPLSVLSNYCLRKHDPEMKFIPSLSLYLYTKYGRAVGIPIFIVLTVISTLIGMARL